MIIPDEIIEQIKQYTDIVDVISEVVELKRRGGNYLGLCPFHNEKTPSFTVSQDKSMYKCFGCGKSGNVFTFMMEYHGLSFIDAAKELAKKSGITIPEEPKSAKAKAQLSKTELAYKALDAAAQHYIKMLATAAGKTAASYYNKRGFSRELITGFGLGYSSESWDTLIRELKRQGFSEETMQDAGLVIEANSEKGRFYDRFRGRAMFPVHNFMGKVIGFGARILVDAPDQPKYLNSPQTIVYDKSKTLYGLFQAKNELRNKSAAILVEGYADVLTLHQAGYKNAVASSGTSLTKEQLSILAKYCKKLYMVYDADSAGIKATDRGLELALEQGFDVNVVQLPAGEDPDSLVRDHGSSIFQVYLNDATSFIDFKVMLLKKEGSLDTPAGKAGAVRSVLKLISRIPDRLQHDDFISHLASLLKVSEHELYKIYEEKLTQEKASPHRESPAQQRVQPSAGPRKTGQDSAPSSKKEGSRKSASPVPQLLPEESLLLQLSLNNAEALGIIRGQFNITPEHFQTEEGKRLFGLIIDLSANSGDIMSALFSSESIAEDDRDFLSGLAIKDNKPSENWSRFARELPVVDVNKVIQDALFKLELASIDSTLPGIQALLKTAPFEEQRHLLEKIKLLSDRKTYIFKVINS